MTALHRDRWVLAGLLGLTGVWLAVLLGAWWLSWLLGAVWLALSAGAVLLGCWLLGERRRESERARMLRQSNPGRARGEFW